MVCVDDGVWVLDRVWLVVKDCEEVDVCDVDCVRLGVCVILLVSVCDPDCVSLLLWVCELLWVIDGDTVWEGVCD